MNARQVDEAARQLGGLTAQTVESLALAVAAVGLALAASQLRPSLALPLLAGGIGVGYLGMRAFVRRAFLIEDLAVDPDALLIPAVERYAQRAASPRHRRVLAGSLRSALNGSSNDTAARFLTVRPELEELIGALEDDRLEWEPRVAVALEQWLDDRAGSFRNRGVPAAQLQATLRTILASVEKRQPPE